MEHALATARTLVTLDKDFGELAIVRGLPHFGIVRLVNLSGPQQGAVCLEVLTRFAAELQRMAIITVETSRSPRDISCKWGRERNRESLLLESELHRITNLPDLLATVKPTGAFGATIVAVTYMLRCHHGSSRQENG